jgi:alpha-aminoadipic semialdehyde synthase
VALTPAAVKGLSQDGVDIHVQRFSRRVFSDGDYVRAGANLVDDVVDCDLVMGIKEMPLDVFREFGAYMFFSHTIKGQPHNMKMLAELVGKRCTLLDYETVVNEKKQRLIFFGRFAGIAGAVDTLWTLGRRLEALGVETPFSKVQPCHTYADLAAAKQAVRHVGERIADHGLPSFMTPAVIGITGYGHVSQGAQEIVDLLPHVKLSPSELPAFVAANSSMTEKVIKVVYSEQDLVEPIDSGRPFDLQDYYDHGEAYQSKFGPNLELLTVLINGIRWDERYPKLADRDQIRDLFVQGKSPRLLVVGDITCDVDGSLACTVRDTDSGDPTYVYDPETRVATSGFEGPGLAVMAVGNLPCELPREASETFSEALMPFMRQIAAADWCQGDLSKVSLPDPIKRSVILWRGEFTADYGIGCGTRCQTAGRLPRNVRRFGTHGGRYRSEEGCSVDSRLRECVSA